MIQSIYNRCNLVPNAGEQKSARTSKNNQEEAPQKNENRDVVEISREKEIGMLEPASQTDAEEKTLLKDSIAEETTQEASESSEEDRGENAGSSGKVGINAGKLARMLAAAKTQEQIQAVIAKIKQDLKECETGKAQGMDVDEASVRAAKNILNQAEQRMGEAANREATPEEEMAFSLAGLM